jgi:hypothetical protein
MVQDIAVLVTAAFGYVLAFGPIAAMAVFGFRHGVFQAVVAVLAILTGLFAGLACAPSLEMRLGWVGVSPGIALPAAYLLVFFLTVGAAWAAVWYGIEEEDVRPEPRFDHFGGAAVGFGAGVLLGGALLVGWSMCELPQEWRTPSRPDNWGNSGAWCLYAFSNWLHSDAERASFVLLGDKVFGAEAAQPKAAPAKLLRASEPFNDTDGDWKRSENERFLDYDGDEKWTVDVKVDDHSSGKVDVRDPGLIDRFWLSAWRTLRVLHHPRITSQTYNPLQVVARSGEEIYQVTAIDSDDDDTLQFSLSPGADAALLRIDPAKGNVRFHDEAVDSSLKKVTFTVVVTDRSGLTDEREVVISFLPITVTPPGP